VNYPIRGFFEKTEISKVTTNGTIIHKTLVLENGNSQLKFGKDEKDGIETIEYMKSLISNDGHSFFHQFEEKPTVFNEIKIIDFEKPSDKFEKFGIDEKMLKWIHFK